METAFVVVVVVTALGNVVAAVMDFLRSPFVLENMGRYGVPRSWMVPLGVAKAVGAVGLVVGLAFPVIAVVSAAYLVLYFVGAVGTVVRARCYRHLAFPSVPLLLAATSLALGLATV
ncbi:DoxX family protein [Nocardia transvalensis]|uniref:DoxX family protein n=1 Tax=Nocardia transvalensis TaxID=37333 RepID=UPI00189459A0|nr:DoxX family protein [Nocardia transvalensis]MBF6334183.1 DoxX family protein [Nocardia transvalensis]